MKPTVSTTAPPPPMRVVKTINDDFAKKEQQLKEQLASLDQQRKQQENALKQQEAARIIQLRENREALLEDARQFEELSLRAVTTEDKIFYVQEARNARKSAAEIILPEDSIIEQKTSLEQPVVLGVSTTQGIWGLIILALATGALFWLYGMSANENDSAARMINSGGMRFLSNVWMSLGSLIFGFAIQWALFPQQFFYYHSKFNTERCLREDFVNPSKEGFYRIACWFFTLALPIWVFVSIFQVILA